MLCDFLQEINITALNHSGSLLKLNPDKGKPLWVTRAFGARIYKWTWRSILEEWVVGVEGPHIGREGGVRKGRQRYQGTAGVARAGLRGAARWLGTFRKDVSESKQAILVAVTKPAITPKPSTANLQLY